MQSYIYLVKTKFKNELVVSKFVHTTIIEVSTQQLIENLVAIRGKIDEQNKNIKFCFPVKANAYGHGLVRVAQIAQPYVDYLAVACLDEGVTLRLNGITKPILVFGAFNEDQVPGLITHNLEITISSLYKARQVLDYCNQTGQRAKIHLKIDTGMNRVGVRVETAPELFQFVAAHPQFILIGVYSHLSCADENERSFTLEQINKFKQIVDLAKSINPNIICHLANSAGLCYYPESYFDMVRPGILSYGYFPNQEIKQLPLSNIKPCFSLKSRINYTKVVAKDQGVSYNRRYITSGTTRVITIPIGYGDGYRRMLSNNGEILLHGKRYTISGTICMDMFMVDIGIHGVGYVDDEVVLIGKQDKQEISLNSVAQKCQTINYEILCGFNERIPRIYT